MYRSCKVCKSTCTKCGGFVGDTLKNQHVDMHFVTFVYNWINSLDILEISAVDMHYVTFVGFVPFKGRDYHVKTFWTRTKCLASKRR